ncbi:MAG: TSUP family transporter [Gammaproteobacteria bacterium]|nr:TSUP family transporter [Gammaproteobacteria bacterium]
MVELFSYSFSPLDLMILISVGLLIGMAKTGVQGTTMIAVPMLAIIFGGMASTGIMLPLLIFADVFGVRHYHRHAAWLHLKKLLPPAFIGVLLGTLTGSYIDDAVFLKIMALILFLTLLNMIWREQREIDIPESPAFVTVIGIAGGFTTMVGNLAGSVMAIYLLAMRFPKNQFIGTAAWFFLIINLFKVPFHVLVWKTITVESFILDILLIPAIAIGAFTGIKITKTIEEKDYRIFVIVMTAIASLAMIV